MIVVPNSRLNVFYCDNISYQPLNWFIFGMTLGIGTIMYL